MAEPGVTAKSPFPSGHSGRAVERRAAAHTRADARPLIRPPPLPGVFIARTR